MQPSAVDVAIMAINMQECYRRRVVRGRDLNEWFTDLEGWILTGQEDEALAFLGEAIAAVETLEQYDNREPQPYWYEKAADIYEDMGQEGNAAKVLQRWLRAWPARRMRGDGMREKIASRVVQLERVAS